MFQNLFSPPMCHDSQLLLQHITYYGTHSGNLFVSIKMMQNVVITVNRLYIYHPMLQFHFIHFIIGIQQANADDGRMLIRFKHNKLQFSTVSVGFV